MQMPEPLAVIELKDHGMPRHLHAFLGLYVPLDYFQGDRAYRRNELQARPDAGQTLLQPWKLFPQCMSRIALDLSHNLGDTDLRVHIERRWT